jgi:hypothetical protein
MHSDHAMGWETKKLELIPSREKTFSFLYNVWTVWGHTKSPVCRCQGLTAHLHGFHC